MSNKKYSNEDLAKALEDIKNGSMTIYRASKVYNIPNQTLHDKINKKIQKTRVSRSSNSPVIDRRRFVGKMGTAYGRNWISSYERSTATLGS